MPALFGICLDSSGQEQVAFVIGNDQYRGFPLDNAVRDATAIRELLTERIGFPDEGIVFGKNLTRIEMFEHLEEFKRLAGEAKVVLLYYAGHGMESLDGRENFLIPVDAELSEVVNSEAVLRASAVNLKLMMTDIAAASSGAKIILMDCCRDRPLGRGSVKSGGGLATYGDSDIPADTMVILAAAPNRTASDGEKHGPFTQALLENLPKPGKNLLDTFFAVGDRVQDLTENRQRAWLKFEGTGKIFRDTGLLSRPSTSLSRKAPDPETEAMAPRDPVNSKRGNSADALKWEVVSIGEAEELGALLVASEDVLPKSMLWRYPDEFPDSLSQSDSKALNLAIYLQFSEEAGIEFVAVTSDDHYLLKNSGDERESHFLILSSAQMDHVGYKAIASEYEIEAEADGTFTIPRRLQKHTFKSEFLARTLDTIESKGWEFCSVSSDNHYIFRERGSGRGRSFRVLSPQEMDKIGFTDLAMEEGLEIAEDGTINFPKEMVHLISKVKLLPRTIQLVEKDGWRLVSVTADNYYIFEERNEERNVAPANGNFEYRAVNPEQMDNVGYKTLANENEIPITEDGKINFPKDMTDKLVKEALLPVAIREIEAEGWSLIVVSADDHYLFRRPGNQ